MGIQGLLPALKSITTPLHVKEYAGKKVAVDTYCWLHKGAVSCSKELCQGQPTSKLIDYCMNRVNLLRHHGVKPLLVFDGGMLPMKEEQESKRARTRKDNLERALEHELSGNHGGAYDCYQKAVDITPSIAFQLIKVLRQENIEYIVAPYEADAQMAFLSLSGHVEVVITEDSDLIPFGCPRVLFKLDKFGCGLEFQYVDLAKNKDLNFTSFTKQMVLEMCILSGCDYLSSLQGMGIKRAHGLMRRFKGHQKVIKHLRYSGVHIPCQYEELFAKAILTFHHQRVYDPFLQDVVHLMPVPADLTSDLEFLGPRVSKGLGQAISRGDMDPITKKKFEEAISLDQHTSISILPETGKLKGRHKRQLDLPIQKNLLTNYYVSASDEAKRQFRAPRNINALGKMIDESLPGSDEDKLQVRNSFGCLDGSEDVLTSDSFTCDHIRTTSNSFVCDVGKILSSSFEINQSNLSRDFDMEDQTYLPQPQKDTHVKEGNKFQCKRFFCAFKEISHGRVTLALETANPFVSSVHQTSSSSLAIKSCDGRAKQHNCMVRSMYFSCCRMKDADASNTGTEQFLSEIEPLDCCQGQTCLISLKDHLSNGIGEITAQQCHAACVTAPKDSNDGCCLDSCAKRKCKSMNDSAAGKRKHVPSFSSSLLDTGAGGKNFALDTSHIKEYARIAHKSVERFASAIAPFHCTSMGARASGLRRPVAKSTMVEKLWRGGSMTGGGGDLTKFAYTPKSPPPMTPRPPSSTVLIATGSALGWNDSSCAFDWD